MRILTLVGLFFAVAVNLGAQQLKWEFGLFLGGANYQGDLVESYGPILEETNPAYGAFSRFYVGREWALRTSYFHGTISGSDENFSTSYFTDIRNVDFSTSLDEISLNLEWEPFGNRRFPEEGGYKRIFSPFAFGGIAYTFVNAKPDYSEVPREGILEMVSIDKNQAKRFGQFAIPFGGGLKIDLSKFATLTLEGGLRMSFSDMLDGVSTSGNPDANDWYSFAGLTYSRKFGPPDFDHDGIADKNDACPRVAGVPSGMGCPDRDGDGVENLEDLCPDLFGDVALNGCPDSDGDRVIDIMDECPYVAGLEEFEGCPDTDEDGITDAKDACPEVAGVFSEDGCPYPDTDGDGVLDKDDNCPEIAGEVEEKGCPFPDIDGDGVPDREDSCPELAGPIGLGGCPDTDADSIVDIADRCPNTPGSVANNGCPEIDEEAKALLALAMESVRFETASATLKPESKDILGQVSDLLERYPDFDLTISGHTDSRGRDDENLQLSELRAKTCFEYFIERGIDPARLTFQGFGESRPLADNASTKGRQRNRRVEFDLFLEDSPILPRLPADIPAEKDSILVEEVQGRIASEKAIVEKETPKTSAKEMTEVPTVPDTLISEIALQEPEIFIKPADTLSVAKIEPGESDTLSRKLDPIIPTAHKKLDDKPGTIPILTDSPIPKDSLEEVGSVEQEKVEKELMEKGESQVASPDLGQIPMAYEETVPPSKDQQIPDSLTEEVVISVDSLALDTAALVELKDTLIQMDTLSALVQKIVRPTIEHNKSSYEAYLQINAEGVFFAQNSARLLEESYPELNRIVKVMSLYPDYQLRITVQTLDQEDAEKNFLLSVKRAKVCMAHLAKLGINQERMLYQGYVINSKQTPPKFVPGALFELFPPGSFPASSTPQPYSEPIEVATEEEKAILLRAGQTVSFQTSSSTLKQSSLAIVDEIARILRENKAYRLRISGHTDSQGTAAFNQTLSEKRAKACLDYLVEKKGISRDRLTYEGFGENQPVASNVSSEGRRQNRRVEFKFFLQ